MQLREAVNRSKHLVCKNRTVYSLSVLQFRFFLKNSIEINRLETILSFDWLKRVFICPHISVDHTLLQKHTWIKFPRKNNLGKKMLKTVAFLFFITLAGNNHLRKYFFNSSTVFFDIFSLPITGFQELHFLNLKLI